MDTYCWIHGTFTLPKLVLEKVETFLNFLTIPNLYR